MLIDEDCVLDGWYGVDGCVGSLFGVGIGVGGGCVGIGGLFW